METKRLTHSELIDLLGGTAAVAQLCKVKPPSVSEWRRVGIPDYRLDFIRLARKRQLRGVEILDHVTA